MRTPNTEALADKALAACVKASSTTDPAVHDSAVLCEIRLLEEHAKTASEVDREKIQAQIEHLKTHGRKF